MVEIMPTGAMTIYDSHDNPQERLSKEESSLS